MTRQVVPLTRGGPRNAPPALVATCEQICPRVALQFLRSPAVDQCMETFETRHKNFQTNQLSIDMDNF